MITILSFKAHKGETLIYCEVAYDLVTKEVIYSSFDSRSKTIEKEKYPLIVIPATCYQANLKFVLENGYKVKINPQKI